MKKDYPDYSNSVAYNGSIMQRISSPQRIPPRAAFLKVENVLSPNMQRTATEAEIAS